MAFYSIHVLGESQISLTGGAVLDGVTQGDGSHLVGEFLTINTKSWEEILIEDRGAETNFADNDGSQRLDGAQTIDGVTYSNGTRIEAEYQFVVRDNNTGIEYTVVGVNIRNSSPAYGTVEALAFVGAVPPAGVSLEIISAAEGPSNGGPNSYAATDYVPICFAGGTQILTTRDERPVEALRPGDKITRQSGGYATLRRVFRSKVSAAALTANPKLRPIRILAGAMGLGLPARDLVVSRQHRMLVSSKISERMFGASDVLVAAIKLTELPGIYIDEALQEVEYFHLLFDAHEVIFAERAPTESLFTGPEALKAVSPDAREEILTLFPDINAPGYAPCPARPIPIGKLQKQLVARHAKNSKPLLESI